MVSELEYRQVESDLRTTQSLPPVIRQLRLRQEGALAVLFGRTPREVYEGRVDPGATLTPVVVEVPAGLPSDLLLLRPKRRGFAGIDNQDCAPGIFRRLGEHVNAGKADDDDER